MLYTRALLVATLLSDGELALVVLGVIAAMLFVAALGIYVSNKYEA